MDLVVHPSKLLKGTIEVPGDKSITHRAFIIASLATGQTQLEGYLASKDCLATLQAVQQLGVTIKQQANTVSIQGLGLHQFTPPKDPIECGNSGTSMRLLAGVLAAQPFSSVLQGDDSLSKRPMERITLPLTLMGADIQGHNAPLTIQGKALQGIHYTLPVESAQIKSCLLLAGLYTKEPTVITEKGQCRDHTERMLTAFGADILINNTDIVLTPGTPLQGQHLTIPGDISSAAFFIATASMLPGARLCVKNVGVNARRIGILAILQQMGANITLKNQRRQNNESIADIEVNGATLQGITIPTQWVVSAMDEFPMLFVVAAIAQGETIIRGIAELRLKESDRIAAMSAGLNTLGIHVEALEDGVIIHGGKLQGGVVDSFGDHRIAMAFAMAGFCAQKEIKIKNCDNIATSFPGFCTLSSRVGLDIHKA